jgi:glycerol-3-phosphate dehydrogenase (NAD+)
MWVFDEQVEDPTTSAKRSLVEIINTHHENVKYLPGIRLPDNVVAVADSKKAVEQADILIWVLPHQFVPRTIQGIKDAIKPTAISISLIKGGLELKGGKLGLCSDSLRELLGHDVSVLMGANVANEVAEGQFCEATIGYVKGSASNASSLQRLFDQPTFRVNVIEDVPGVELCGGLKNVVALGAGFSDGMGCGGNTKAAIVRIGLHEMKEFIRHFYPNVRDETFLESCGIADLFTTCVGGRNRKCAEAFAKTNGKRPWADIEAELLGGQKLQGTLTAEEIWPVMVSNSLCERLPLLTSICQIALHGRDVSSLTDFSGSCAPVSDCSCAPVPDSFIGA